MPRVARFVAVGLPHHVTHRGNNQECVFLTEGDRLEYLARIRFYGEQAGVAVFGYCLMSNHVHLVLRPERADSLACLLRRAHGEYAQRFNRRRGRSGHLWQDRYGSCPLERGHIWNALRYVDLNPVRARLVEAAEQWRWSSAAAHLRKELDEFGLLDGEWRQWRDWPDWNGFLQGADPNADKQLREQTRRCRPLGSREFVRHWEEASGRRLEPRPNGRPRKTARKTAVARA